MSGTHGRAGDHRQPHAVLREAVYDPADHGAEADLPRSRSVRPRQQGDQTSRTCSVRKRQKEARAIKVLWEFFSHVNRRPLSENGSHARTISSAALSLPDARSLLPSVLVLVPAPHGTFFLLDQRGMFLTFCRSRPVAPRRPRAMYCCAGFHAVPEPPHRSPAPHQPELDAHHHRGFRGRAVSRAQHVPPHDPARPRQQPRLYGDCP